MSGADKYELISNSTSRDLSSSKLRVKFTEKEQNLGVITLNPGVLREIEVVLLSNSVKKGQILNKSDLKMAKVWAVGKEESFCLKIEEALGFECRKNMLEGSKIPLNSLSEPIFALKDQFVQVEVKIGKTVSFRVKGKALQQGRRGDYIRIRNTNSGKEITAQLIEKGIARVD